MKQIFQTKKSGFSLVESMIAVFIFSLVAVMLTGTFSNLLNNYIKAKKAQRNIENAQYAMNIMAKTIRTSGVVSNVNFPLDIFDYSHNLCFRYDYVSATKKIRSGSQSAANLSACTFGSIALNDFADSIDGASVDASASVPGGSLGKVTVALRVKEAGQTTSDLPIQMSVSLRQ